MKKFFAIFRARNIEFLRDRSTLGWSLFFPLLLVAGFAYMFTGEPRDLFKVGVTGGIPESASYDFFDMKYVSFIPIEDRDSGIVKVDRFQLDMLIDPAAERYWVNANSQNGYILERILRAGRGERFERQVVTGREVRYVDWVIPGILGMNMMFSCLFGVGYVIVRYRKNGFLKRLKATPLKPLEFLLAQMSSRMLLIQVVTIIIYAGTNYFVDFQMRGSYLNLLLVSLAGSICLISLGLLVAARLSSEEVAGGILNVITWPMMLFSGVWFSLEGTNPVVREAAKLLPLTHVVDAARAIMIEGAGLAQIAPNLTSLLVMTVLFLAAGAAVFRWE